MVVFVVGPLAMLAAFVLFLPFALLVWGVAAVVFVGVIVHGLIVDWREVRDLRAKGEL
jgi:hypothetical protein